MKPTLRESGQTASVVAPGRTKLLAVLRGTLVKQAVVAGAQARSRPG